MASNQIEIKGKKMMYYVYGTGKPVVLIHGFGEDHSIWHNQIAYFKNQYQLIIPDLPGSGALTFLKNWLFPALKMVKLIGLVSWPDEGKHSI